MKTRILRITNKLLHDLLKLPDDCKVTGFSYEVFFERGDYALRIESESFAEIKEGCTVPHTSAVYALTETGRKFIGWSIDHPLKPDEQIVSSRPATIPPTPPKRGREFI